MVSTGSEALMADQEAAALAQMEEARAAMKAKEESEANRNKVRTGSRFFGAGKGTEMITYMTHNYINFG